MMFRWIKICLFVCSVFVFGASSGLAQVSDTLQSHLKDIIEEMARSANEDVDYSSLMEQYLYYAEHPVNFNGSQLEKLVEVRILNQAQLFSIQAYINHYGPLFSANELDYIPGLSFEAIRRLKPFVVFKKAEQERTKIPFRKLLKYGRNQLLFRFKQTLEKSSGYNYDPDSAYLKPGSVYLGPPQKLYFKYIYQIEDKFKAGFAAEKDPGEVLLGNNISDSVKKLLHHVPSSPDFLSGFVSVSNLGFIKRLVFGDYNLEFGQGLTLWSGLAFGKSQQSCLVQYYGKGIRPNTSVNENVFFRGVASTFEYKNWELTAFYSRKNYDAHEVEEDSTEMAGGLLQTGYHRTINELNNKNVLGITIYGTHLKYNVKRIELGATYYENKLSFPIQESNESYGQFYFHGDRLSNAGFNLNMGFDKFSFFSELSSSSGGNFAGTAGVNTFFSNRFTMTLLYRNFDKEYQTLFANPFRESNHVGNEEGFYLGLEVLLSKYLTFNAYADLFRFPWLRYQKDEPSSGKAFLMHLKYESDKDVSMTLRMRFTGSEDNYTTDSAYFSRLEDTYRYEFRYQIDYKIESNLALTNRLEYVRYIFQQDKENGFMIYQDVFYRPKKIPFSAGFRFALFNTDGWNSRIYTYENDVLYAYSIPALYDHGNRMYLLLKWEPLNNLKVWFRASSTLFYGKESIGSGTETINGNHKTDVKFELQWKF